jgi:hypothetical protein
VTQVKQAHDLMERSSFLRGDGLEFKPDTYASVYPKMLSEDAGRRNDSLLRSSGTELQWAMIDIH